MGRLWQLKKTLPYNLERLKDDEEICLANFNSQDGLDEWIHGNYIQEIKAGRLRYFYTKEPKHFHMSKAKNLSHRLSTGQFVFNLDVDNFISETTRERLKPLEGEPGCLREGTDGGYAGRIGINRDLFFSIGGYDESLLPMGYEDHDLWRRVQKFVGRVILYDQREIKDLRPLILNTKKDKTQNLQMEYKNLRQMHYDNKSIARSRISPLVNQNGMTRYRGILYPGGEEAEF